MQAHWIPGLWCGQLIALVSLRSPCVPVLIITVFPPSRIVSYHHQVVEWGKAVFRKGLRTAKTDIPVQWREAIVKEAIILTGSIPETRLMSWWIISRNADLSHAFLLAFHWGCLNKPAKVADQHFTSHLFPGVDASQGCENLCGPPLH